jgi:D-serine deaminase-like pyridoxal phosphate-dependent protein
VKTHKTLETERYQFSDEFNAITVSTLAEARFFLSGDVRDQIYAVPLSRSKLAEIEELNRKGGKIKVLLDSQEMIHETSRFAQERKILIEACLKVDCGYNRAGVSPSRPEGFEAAFKLEQAEGLVFKGILTHAG